MCYHKYLSIICFPFRIVISQLLEIINATVITLWRALGTIVVGTCVQTDSHTPRSCEASQGLRDSTCCWLTHWPVTGCDVVVSAAGRVARRPAPRSMDAATDSLLSAPPFNWLTFLFTQQMMWHNGALVPFILGHILQWIFNKRGSNIIERNPYSNTPVHINKNVTFSKLRHR